MTPLIIGKTRCFKKGEFEETISPSFKKALSSEEKLRSYLFAKTPVKKHTKHLIRTTTPYLILTDN